MKRKPSIASRETIQKTRSRAEWASAVEAQKWQPNAHRKLKFKRTQRSEGGTNAAQQLVQTPSLHAQQFGIASSAAVTVNRIQHRGPLPQGTTVAGQTNAILVMLKRHHSFHCETTLCYSSFSFHFGVQWRCSLIRSHRRFWHLPIEMAHLRATLQPPGPLPTLVRLRVNGSTCGSKLS